MGKRRTRIRCSRDSRNFGCSYPNAYDEEEDVSVSDLMREICTEESRRWWDAYRQQRTEGTKEEELPEESWEFHSMQNGGIMVISGLSVCSAGKNRGGRRIRMGFQDGMRQMLLRVAAGEVEPKEWETWWNSNKAVLEESLSRGDRGRMMPALWSANYYWMAKTQSGVAYYFHSQGRPVKTSGYYEEKAKEEEFRNRQKAMEAYHRKTASARRFWEEYLEKHPTETISFDWKSLLGTPPGQKPAKAFSYKNARTIEQWKECGEELKLRLKENLQAKIAPVAKAYGMKKAGPKTFVREKNGLVSRIQFIGYFRGGGYEAMTCYLCPIYAIQYGILSLPGDVSQGEYFQKMLNGWGVIEYGMEAVDAAMVEGINRKFDDILTFLADGVLPEWQKIDSLETYFAKERRDYLKATEKGPNDPRTGRPMWNPDGEEKPDPWRADSYLSGVWNLLNGKEKEGYARLEECVRHNSDYMEVRLKEFPNACNDPRDPIAVMYRNAQLFLETKEIPDAQKRQDAIRETYEEVCRFMRYYHGLAKKTERS